MTDFIPRLLSDYTPSLFSITSVDLEVDLSDSHTKVINTMHITKQGDGKQRLSLDGEQLHLVSVKLNEVELSANDYELNDHSLSLVIEKESFTLVIETQIDPQANSSLEGLFKSGNAFCTQCEAEGFRRITYYLDRPDVMSVFSTKVIADKALYPYLLSNGNSVDSGDLPDGKHFVSWQDPFPKPCYLFALVAGDFDLLVDNFVTMSGRNVKLEIFVDRGNLSKAGHAMSSLKRSMKWDEETFGLEYDLDIYMIVAVDFFNMGAMENKGLNVFNSKFVLADKTCATDTDYFNIEAVIGHEYFHNWTGNRVTCRDWFQLSLKEGLTVFRDQQFSADMHSKSVTRIQNVSLLRAQQFAEDAGPMAHPIRPEKVVEMNNFYTLTVYEKGAEVIRMMHTILGKENFRKGMDLYFERFDGMAVTCDDFVQAMQDASSIDLSVFSRWYSQSGTPVVTVSESYNSEEQTFSLRIKQSLTNNTQNDALALHIPIRVELFSTNKKSSHYLLDLKELEQEWTFENFSEKPIVAFLGDFSAPVKVDYPQSDQTLMAIMSQAEDEFCRWDAGQKLYTNYLIKLTLDNETHLPDSLLVAFETILHGYIDNALKAEQILLPSFHELSSLIDEVSPQALIQAINTLKLFFAQRAKQSLYRVYQDASTVGTTDASTLETTDESAEIAKRALKAACLSYLTLLDEFTPLIQHQLDSTSNMTDSLSALTCSAKNNLSNFPSQMADFEQQWSNDTLVMDKWFTINTGLNSDEIFEHLNYLTNHPLFSINNPNRARSVIGAFAGRNPKYFHDESGRGYKFLADHIILLNEINPQVASRLITPLIQFKEFCDVHQQLMKAELTRISQLDNLSNDLKEKLDAALNDVIT